MHTVRKRRAVVTFAVMLALLVGAALVGRLGGDATNVAGAKLDSKLGGGAAEKDFAFNSQGVENGGAGGEAFEALTAATQFNEARTAPSGIVAPGAYTGAYNQLTGLGTAGGSWSEVTNKPYDADDIDYRDYFSNSSGGAGLVTGRIVGLTADDAGNVYAAGANGGVWRAKNPDGVGAPDWTPIADNLPSLSSGDLQLDGGALWYATGEANTGGTSYAGSGVYRLASPTTGTFAVSDRVGGIELESTTINALRFAGDKVWAATLRGVWFHSRSTASGPWTLAYAPNPGWLPASLQAYSTTQGGFGTINTAGNSNAGYKNIVNDIAIDPKNPNHVIAAIGWRSGDTYNGFYETTDGGTTWVKTNPAGAINANDIGNVTFAFSSDGKKLYAINQAPSLLNKLTGTVNSYLDGIYVSQKGIAGPWNKIAESQKLANSGSALKQSVGGKGYGPGIQAWYNQFLIVDPADSNHVYAGLEEVYETKDGGSSWSTVGPYWNFYFSCWRPDSVYAPGSPLKGCPQSTHSDQHSVAIGKVGGVPTLFVGNDGGVYKRPVSGSQNANGNATDWTSLNDGSINALQYYAVDVGKAKAGVSQNPDGDGAIVSGGLQDNGGSIYREGGAKMSSNFGGDGGDVLVDPENGCNIVQEYVVLSMRVTNTCAHPPSLDAFLDLSKSTTYSIAPPDINARFIAPFGANKSNIDEWLAGGNSLWVQSKGFAIRSGSEWKRADGSTLADGGKTYTALSMRGDKAVAGWCGPCNNQGFARGIVIGTRDASKASGWSFAAAPETNLPLRYVGGVEVGSDGSIYAVMNGFSRRFTEGPGAGVGHVFKLVGTSWVDISANFPDVPANSITSLPNGALIVGTDLAVLYRAPGATNWSKLGSGLPLTVALDVEVGPAGNDLYVATHGRGIWKIQLPA